MLFSPDLAARQLRDVYTKPNKQLGTQVTWALFNVYTGSLTSIYIPQESALPGLKIPDVENFSFHLFDKGDNLAETLEQLSGKRFTKIDSLRAAALQWGTKAHILFYEAVMEGDPYYFVTYLSRTPNGTGNAEETVLDFENLRWLSQQYKRLSPAARGKFDIIRPISLGQARYQRCSYPFFTMPFIPWGELCLEAIAVMKDNQAVETFPFFRYSVDYTAEMSKVSETQARVALTVARYALDLMPRDKLEKTPEVQRFHNQRKDLYKACALIHLLSGGQFPVEQQVNAGDFMAIISGHGLQTKLGTIRGGFRLLRGVEEFMEKVRNQIEVSPYHGVQLSPFRNMIESEMADLYNEAQGLIIN